jgi:hypothetical protein
MDAVSNVLCAYCMRNVHTFHVWEDLLRGAGLKRLQTQSFDQGGMSTTGMLADEGPVNTGRIMLKYTTNSRIRARMSTMGRFFEEHADTFGYGVYTGRK